jgi:hypothetical protein
VPAAQYAAWLTGWLWVLEIGLLVTFALLLFPTGRLPGPRWRIVAWLAASGMLMACLSALTPGELDEFTEAVVQNPLGVSGLEPLLEGLSIAGVLAIAISAVASAASLFVRLRRSEGVERQQMKWFAFAAGLAALGVVTTIAGYAIWGSETGDKAAFALVTLFGLPIAGGIAILRYRLYEIDVLINRTLVYVSLTAILAGLYAASIQLFKFVFEAVAGGGSQATIVITTLVLAAVFTPVKNFLQTFVDRYFGRVSEPRKEIATFAEQLRLVTRTFDPAQTLPQFLNHALRIANATGGVIHLTGDGEEKPFVAAGELTGPEVARVPLGTGGDEIGWLVLRGSETAGLAAEDRELLQDVANLVAKAVTLAMRTGLRATDSLSVQLTH